MMQKIKNYYKSITMNKIRKNLNSLNIKVIIK